MQDNTTPAAVQDMSTAAIERELTGIPTTIPLPISAEDFDEYQRKQQRRRALRAELQQRSEDAA